MKSIKIFGLLLLVLFLALSIDIYAVSLSPELVQKLKEEGRLEEVVRRANLAREKGVWAPNPNPPIKFGKDGSLLTDTLRPIVICVDFDDNVHSRDTSEFSLLLFSKNFTYPTGSMRDYYLENSYGSLDLVGGIAGWYRMPQLYSYYVDEQYGWGSYPRNAQKLAEDAVDAADPDVNFADYDYDEDGWVDGLIIFHAGLGAEETGDSNDIWSHNWVMSHVVQKDGVNLHTYNMDPEIRSGGQLVDIGVIGHEYGHFLGLPDLYDTDYSSEGVGDWSMMASGSWNNSGKTPAHFDAWCKSKLGFSQVDRLTENRTDVEILQAETSPVSYRLWTSGINTSKYFMVENRQKVGFDKYLPGSGLLIYHVDENKSGNTQEWCPGDLSTWHYKVALEQADGRFQLEGCYGSPNQGNSGDPFPGSDDKIAFDDTTTADSRNYHPDSITQVAVWDISDSDSAMHANMDVTWSRPCLYLDELILDDLVGGDGDGRAESGETVRLYFTISNIWLPINSTTVTVSADTAGIIFTDDYSYLGDIGTDDSANNYSDPMEFEVDSLFPGRPTIFTLHVEGDTGSGGTYTLDFDVEIWAGDAEILIVADDSGSATNYQSHYTAPLDSLKEIYDIWDTEGKGDPDFSFNDYKYIIWYTGDHKTDLFTQAQVESLMSFLDKGGRLWLTSQDAVEALSNSGDPLDSIFLTDYLHCSLADGNCSPRLVRGEPGDTVGDTLYIHLWGSASPQNQTSKDALIPDSLAIPILRYGKSWTAVDSVAGIRYQDDYYKLVLFGFGFEGIDTSGGLVFGQYVSKSHFVVQRVIEWLKGPLPTIDLIYPNGGDTLAIGDTCWSKIQWKCLSFEDSVKIEYSTTAGSGWSTLIVTPCADTVYSWIVPEPPSDSCLIRISDIGNGVPFDTSEGYFSVVSYISGDGNHDGVVNSGDVVYLINYLFKGGPPPIPMAAGDANCDCVINSSDVVYMIDYLFKGGPPPGCAK